MTALRAIASPAPGRAMPLAGKRIALFSGNYNYIRDGANQALNRLVRHVEQEGATVRIYSPTTTTPAFEPAGALVSVPSIGFPGRGEYRLATRLPTAIRQDIRRFNPDLVHLSAPDILGTRALAFAKTELGVPVIASLHTRFEVYFGYYGLGWIRRWIETHLARFYGRCDYVLVPTRPLLDEMSQDGADRRIRLWGRGVDHLQFNPEQRSEAWRRHHGYGPDDIVPLFFGRLVLEKGIDRFAEIMAALEGMGHTIRPLVIGDGPARDRLARLMPQARFAGQLTGSELGTAVASADILINPSESEAFGNVVLEAMASGLAIVAADNGSTRNIVTHEQDGLLCAGGSASAYARAVSELIQNPDRRRRLGRQAAAKAQTLQWDMVLDAVVGVYAEALRR